MGGPLAALGAKSKGGPRFSRSTERARGPRFGDKVTPFVAKGLRTKREHGTKRPRKPSPINKRFRIRKPKGQDHGSGRSRCPLRRRRRAQIGRASWRVRVCGYV